MQVVNAQQQAKQQIKVAWQRIAEHNAAADRGLIPEIERAHAQALAEQSRVEIEAKGLVPCEMPWCGNLATRVWDRTPAEIKKLTRKAKSCRTPVEDQSIRCDTHVPAWRQDNYGYIVRS